MRIDKFLSELGIATRREAQAAAKRGLVAVNGIPERDLSRHIQPESDRIEYGGRVIEYRRYTYVMLNKPEGYVSATEDSKLPVVTELLSEEQQRMGLFPVGRLDRDTVGLMILTNNGALAHALLSPKRHVEKEYRFKCAEPLDESAVGIFAKGITLSDGYECKSAGLVLDSDGLGGIITLTEGKYHQIKRMLGALGNRVTYLERIKFGGIELDASLSRGESRLLSDAEIALLESKATK